MIGQSSRTLCLLAVFILLVSLFGCGGGMSPSEVVEKYWTLVGEGEHEEALKYVASEAQMQMMFGMSMAGLSTMFGLRLTGVKTLRQDISDGTATVRYYIRLSDGSATDPDTIKLVKEDGRWKIGLQETELW